MNAMTRPADPSPPSAPEVGISASPWQVAIFEALKANRLDTFVHVPDLVLADLIGLAEHDAATTVYAPAKEEEGIGIACGAFLGGRQAVVVMQNSGMGNVVNALASMALPAQIPFLILISQRGELNEFNAAQVGMAQVLRPMLDALGVPHFTLERMDEIGPTLDGATALAFSTERPVAIILSPLLTGGKKGS